MFSDTMSKSASEVAGLQTTKVGNESYHINSALLTLFLLLSWMHADTGYG